MTRHNMSDEEVRQLIDKNMRELIPLLARQKELRELDVVQEYGTVSAKILAIRVDCKALEEKLHPHSLGWNLGGGCPDCGGMMMYGQKTVYCIQCGGNGNSTKRLD